MSFIPLTPHIAATPENISITVPDETGRRSLGTASANVHLLKAPEDNCWWVSRVLVSDKHRGQGWGGMMLDQLIVEITKQDGQSIIVTPGGYGADPVRQQRFYEAHDFIKTGEGATAHWLWTRSEETARNLAVRAAGAIVRRTREAPERLF
jgi:GNAT superfamily N-acetyltransferase